MSKRYIYAIQDAGGREYAHAYLEPAKVGDVTAVDEGGRIVLNNGDDKVLQAAVPEDGEYYLHRWPADDKRGEPVSKKITAG